MSGEKNNPPSYFPSNINDQPAPFNRPNAKSMFPTAPQVPKKPNSEQMGYSQPNPPNNPNPPLYENVSLPHQPNPYHQQLGMMTPYPQPQYLAQPGSSQQQQQSNVIILGGQSVTPSIAQPGGPPHPVRHSNQFSLCDDLRLWISVRFNCLHLGEWVRSYCCNITPNTINLFAYKWLSASQYLFRISIVTVLFRECVSKCGIAQDTSWIGGNVPDFMAIKPSQFDWT